MAVCQADRILLLISLTLARTTDVPLLRYSPPWPPPTSRDMMLQGDWATVAFLSRCALWSCTGFLRPNEVWHKFMVGLHGYDHPVEVAETLMAEHCGNDGFTCPSVVTTNFIFPSLLSSNFKLIWTCRGGRKKLLKISG